MTQPIRHTDYYRFQAAARGVESPDDVVRVAHEQAYIYDRIITPWLPPGSSIRAADLGCGHGSFLVWLRGHGIQNVVGIDSSAEQVAIARGAGLTAEHRNILDWLREQAPGSFDILFGIDLIEHLPKDEFVSLLALSQRALAPGGRLILRYPNGDSPLVGLNLFNDITHQWTYTTNCLRSLSRMTDFFDALFIDQSDAAIRDHRWIKVPFSRVAQTCLRLLFKAACRENVRYLSPHMWACLTK
jgi:SAM-dependent methyltransferase